MPLLFKDFCDLLSDLESYSSRQPPLLPARREKLYQDCLTQWFHIHQISVDSPNVDPVVLLSALLPARRTDRVYSIQAQSLSKKLRRCLNLGVGRWQQLEHWKTPGRGDLGACVERVQRQAENPVPLAAHAVTLEEIDRVLANIAKTNRFSAPSVRGNEPTSSPAGVVEGLQRLYHRLQSREAKWLTRMILKEYPILELKESMLFRCLDARLPAMMRIQDSFEAAIDSLRSENTLAKAGRHGGGGRVEVNTIDKSIPKIGVKVGRATYLKGRSVKQVVNMVNGRKMSIERKYDGEYCQIHIDLSKGEHPIQIFSKSGKDSTRDREKLHAPIMQSLRIGSNDCGFAKTCILEGEMVVWSDTEHKILPFCKLRKHVNRSGSFLGVSMDSQIDSSEHLMMVFYDVLLIDDDPLLRKPYYYRRATLERLMQCIKGKAKLTTRREIPFAQLEGPRQLQNMLACAFVRQWEGIILKPLNDPYFRSSNKTSHEFASCWIKMKKDYIPGLGDAADFAVVGAGYCTKEAAAKGISKLKWTHFYIGCLRNKSDVVRFGAKPQFTVVDRVNQSITSEDLISLNRLGQFRAISSSSHEAKEAFSFDFRLDVSKMSVVFKEPFVFELLGAGFDKLPNQNILTLRFPRIQKVHWDRDWKDAVSLEELQELAEQARSAPTDDDLKDIKAWMDRLDQVDRGANGATLPWDDSQEHKEIEQYRPHHSPKSRRHTGSSLSAPMIRMDTVEMTSMEQRLESGEVVEESESPHSSARGMSEDTPLTSSNSSPSQSQTHNVDSRMVLPKSPQQGNLKRLAMSDEGDSARVFKKAKTQEDDSSSAKEADTPLGIYQRMKTEPLKIITNSVCPRHNLRIKSPSVTARQKFSMVRSMAMAFHDRLNRKFQGLLEPLSHEHETNTPPDTTQPTGQSTQHTSQADESSELMHLSRPGPNSTDPPFTPPASLHDPTSTNPMPAVQIPNITEWKVLLTSCVLDLPYSLVTDILRPPDALEPIRAFWLSSSGGLHGPLLTPEHSHDQSLLVLVDESHEEATWEVMKMLLAFMPLWNPAQIAIWDWRFLRAMTGEGNQDTMKKNCFLADMVWAGDEEKKEGEIEIRWRGGTITRVPPEKV